MHGAAGGDHPVRTQPREAGTAKRDQTVALWGMMAPRIRAVTARIRTLPAMNYGWQRGMINAYIRGFLERILECMIDQEHSIFLIYSKGLSVCVIQDA